MTLDRRQFLTAAAGAGVAGAAALGALHTPIEEALGLAGTTSSRPAAKPVLAASHPTTLVLVALYGGNDGLNTVIPYHDPAYLAARPTLGYPANAVIALDGSVGLHPNLKGLKSLWDAKRLAVVQGVGYPGPNHSHFRSMDIWQSAVPETAESTGWLGRWLDQLGGKDPLVALSLGPTMPKLLEGAKVAGASVPSGRLALPHAAALEGPFRALETPFAGESPLATRIAQSGTDLLTVLHSVSSVLAAQPPLIEPPSLEGGSAAPPTTAAAPSPAKPPGGGGALASQLDLVARLIAGGLPTRVYVVSLGGFDTHANERANHDRLMTELDAGLTGFVNAMATHPQGQGVVVATFSEFGRRLAQNASGGTDHGEAAPLFVTGPGVVGGLYGEAPSLTALDAGDVTFTTDFRSVYATLVERVLGVDPASLLEGRTFPTLAFV